MATINLGAIKFNWKGAYNSSTTYAVDDVVSSGGNSYVCIQAHSNQAVGDATAYWNIMSAKGTNGTDGSDGTDLTSTLSARGDLVFKGASALTRLPKGTAGYVLKQGANDPEWGTAPSGDCVKLGKVTISSGVGQVEIQGFFDDAVYSHYTLSFYGVSTTNDSGSSNIYLRMQTGSYTDFTGNNYHSVNNSATATQSGNSNGSGNQYQANYWDLSYNNLEADVGRGLTGYLNLYMPATSGLSLRTTGFNASFHAAVANFYSNSHSGHLDDNGSVFTGMKIYPSGGNLDGGEFVLHGFKK